MLYNKRKLKMYFRRVTNKFNKLLLWFDRKAGVFGMGFKEKDFKETWGIKK